jgi:hypothetical protein
VLGACFFSDSVKKAKKMAIAFFPGVLRAGRELLFGQVPFCANSKS